LIPDALVLGRLFTGGRAAVDRGQVLVVVVEALQGVVHHLKLNVGLVGVTSKGRKGMSWNYVRELMSAADELWTDERVQHGLSTGEGLIHTVRDSVESKDEDGNIEIMDEGVEDKRLLVLEAELARVLKVMDRPGNTLSPMIRQAWDDGTLQTLTKNSPAKATGAHVSIIGHITKTELLRHLAETETANGFANRFLWLMVRRSKELPFGGEWHKVNTTPMVKLLRVVLDFGKNAGEIRWGNAAREVWSEVYGPLSEGKPGLFGAVVGRAEAQVVRMAAIYAVMDESNEIEGEHLSAALALWDYAQKSARYIFGDATGDAVADPVLEALRRAGKRGLTRTEISNRLGRNRSADRIDRALNDLLKLALARQELDKNTGGRAAERWFAT